MRGSRCRVRASWGLTRLPCCESVYCDFVFVFPQQLLRDSVDGLSLGDAAAMPSGAALREVPAADTSSIKPLALAVLTDDLVTDLLRASQHHLENREPRVRNTVVDVLQWAARRDGVAVFRRMYPDIIASIRANFERGDADASGTLAAAAGEASPAGDVASAAGTGPASEARSTDDGAATATSPAPPVSSASAVSSSSPAPAAGSPAPKPAIAHDTVGWKALESSFRALTGIIAGCGAAVLEGGSGDEGPVLTEELLCDVVPRATKHINRFVRQAVYGLAQAIVEAVGGAGLVTIGLADPLADLLAEGLSDNWSQVRFAASCCVRSFLQQTAEYRSKYYKLLVPRMALNRYYVAEGVKLYSQETWRVVMGAKGAEIVADCIDAVVEFYLKQSDADNHAVREAACHCIAELAVKVEKAAVAPHVPALLEALLVCFQDESWPVRDAACLASGRFVLGFPEESRPVLERLYTLWMDHLCDNIWSVREDSAVALADVMRAYGDEAIERVVTFLDGNILKVKEQERDSAKHGDLSNSTLFGVAAKRARDNDVSAHTGNQVYSCGSLAPKLRKGGCMDHGFARAKQPWEATDGAIYLLRELATVAPDRAVKFLPALAEVAGARHFIHYNALQETLWKQLPAIAVAVGKKEFKRHLQPFLSPLFICLRSSHRLASHAAGECVACLRDFVGVGIFKGRLEPDDLDTMQRSHAHLVPPEGSRRPTKSGSHGGVGGVAGAPPAFGGAGGVTPGAVGRAPWAPGAADAAGGAATGVGPAAPGVSGRAPWATAAPPQLPKVE